MGVQLISVFHHQNFCVLVCYRASPKMDHLDAMERCNAV